MAAGRSRRRRKPTAKVRSFQEADIPALVSIFQQESVVFGTLQLPYQESGALSERLRTPPPGLHRLVAELGGEVVGVVSVKTVARPRLAHTGCLGMAVAEGARRQGIGAALLDAIIELSEGWLGLQRLELSVWVDNEAAIQLYRSREFHVEGVARAHGLRAGKLVDSFYMARVRSQLAYPRVTAEEAATRLPPLLPAGPDPNAN